MDLKTGFSDIIGMVGVVCILLTYAALQLEKLDPKKLPYSLLNAIGALLITLSLTYDFNLSAFVIEASWFLISLFGIAHVLHKRFKAKAAPKAQSSQQPQDQ